jgi:hypothetical protein
MEVVEKVEIKKPIFSNLEEGYSITEKQLWEMALGQTAEVFHFPDFRVLRVPGGVIYFTFDYETKRYNSIGTFVKVTNPGLNIWEKIIVGFLTFCLSGIISCIIIYTLKSL